MSPPGIRLRPDQRLALACACACETSVIHAAAAEIAEPDWPAAVRLFDHHFIAPVVLSRLNGFANGAKVDARLAPLGEAVTARTKRGLLLQATMRALQDDHLAPLGVRYAMLKGLSLGARYYDNPGLRVARDIDVLIEPSRLEPVLRSLIEAGYELPKRLRVDRGRRPLIDHAVAMARFSKEIALVSPHGVPVEIHHRVEASGNAFPTAGLLERAETIEIWKRPWPVLSTTDLFAYICAHHARHRWSRLHWVLDLSMMMRHPSYARDQVLRRAEPEGVRRVVEAAIPLPEALSAVIRDQPAAPGPRLTAAFVEDCIAHLEPEDAPEQVRRRGRGAALASHTLGDVRRQWLFRDTWSGRLAEMIAMVAPRIADYQALPLPARVHRAYWMIRPVRLAARAVGRTMDRLRR
jgi:hypothetical protein